MFSCLQKKIYDFSKNWKDHFEAFERTFGKIIFIFGKIFDCSNSVAR